LCFCGTVSKFNTQRILLVSSISHGHSRRRVAHV
jgi:hypothetical protein